ncbi:MAG: HAD family hydrolase [Chloroflexota bacterium]
MFPTNPIELIAVDLDGTLLNSQHQLSERTVNALRKAMEHGVQVVLATGKTRRSAQEAIERLDLATPGVYLQGLILYNGDGSVRAQQQLEPELARQLVEFAGREAVALAAYSGLDIYTPKRSAQTDKLARYHEPLPQEIPAAELLALPINKILLIDEPERVSEVREQLAPQVEGRATLVQALDDMLEILPFGASKGAGLKRLLDDLGIAPERVLAIGDAENDIEMLQLAGIGVAVGNAMPQTKAAADFVVASNDEDGVAEAVERFVFGKNVYASGVEETD